MGPHILVVDDDQVCAEAIGLLLRGAGYQVSVAHHFNEALQILEASPPPDVLIADIVMPSSINGLALARMARMRNLAIRTIYISGYDVPAVHQEATGGPLLRKPLADDELLATVAAQLSTTGGTGKT